MIGRAAWSSIEGAEGPIESLITSRQRPVGQSLVEERGAEADEQFVHPRVGVDPHRSEHQVAVADRRARRGGELRDVADPLAADPPEGLEREALPLLVASNLRWSSRRAAGAGRAANREIEARPAALTSHCRRSDEPPRRSRTTHRRVSATIRAWIGRRDFGTGLPECVGLGDVPDQLLGRAVEQGVLEHRQPDVQPRPQAGDNSWASSPRSCSRTSWSSEKRIRPRPRSSR